MGLAKEVTAQRDKLFALDKEVALRLAKNEGKLDEVLGKLDDLLKRLPKT